MRPQPDFDRAADHLRERVGDVQVYDPATDALVEERVRGLLTDGLTEDDAVQIALLNNKGFQAMFLGIGASRADVVQSTLLTNPSLFFSVRFPDAGGRSDINVGLGQELVDLWQIPVRKRIAEAELEQTILGVLRQGIDLAADVRTRYYQVAALQNALRITAENLELVRQSLQLAERRLNVGESGQLDVNLLRASVLDVQTGQISLTRDHEVARAGLGRALGLSRWIEPWTITAPSPGGKEPVPRDIDLIYFAMRERPDASAAARRVEAADGELSRQYLNIFSKVELGVEGERLERRALPGRKPLANTLRQSIRAGQLTAPDLESRGERNLERRQIIDSLLGPTLSVTLPIWDQNQAQIAKASYKAQQARREYEDLLDEVAKQVSQAAVALRNAHTLVRFYDEQILPQARQNLDLARRSYEAGEQGILALIQAQQALIQQRLTAVNIQRDYEVARAELRRAVGGRLTAPGPTSAPASQPAEPTAEAHRPGGMPR